MLGRYDFKREDVDFSSRGVRCAAWLYRPEGVDRPPIVVMAHGFAGERTFGLVPFAERFAAAGLAVMLFDYRCFGDSDGEPRNWVSPRRHRQDWEAAIGYARALPGIDRERIVLWGTSFSGGHVLSVAAGRDDIKALIAQVPFVDGIAAASIQSPWKILRCAGAGLLDLLSMALRRPPHYVPVVGRPDEFAVLNTPECYFGMQALVPPDSKWENRVPARILLTISPYRPVARVHRIRCPALLVLAEDDSLIPAEAVERTAGKIPSCRLERLDCNHFEPYLGDWFEKNIALQEDFLRQRFLAA